MTWARVEGWNLNVLQLKQLFIYTYADTGIPKADSADPPTWEIKYPFDRKKIKYYTNYSSQLMHWWKPLQDEYSMHLANVNTKDMTIVAIRQSPQLGLHIVIRVKTKESQIQHLEHRIIELMNAAKESWKPRRIEKDPLYAYRKNLIQCLPYSAGIVGILMVCTLTGNEAYTFILKDGTFDTWYLTLTGIGALIAACTATVFLMKHVAQHPFALSIWVTSTALASTLSAATTSTFGLNVNKMFSTSICVEQIEVLHLSQRGSKGKTYYAMVNAPNTCELDTNHIEVSITREHYNSKPIMLHMTLHKGIFGRYFIETRP